MIMKRLAVITLATSMLGVVSCQHSDLDVAVNDESSDFVLNVSAPSSQTRIDYSDTESGINLKWAEGDKFSVFEADTEQWIADFELDQGVGSESAQFVLAEGGKLDPSKEYVATYPARKDSGITSLSQYSSQEQFSNMTQSGTSYEHFNSSCMMKAEFTGSNVAFKHTAAIVTVKFATPDSALPTEMYFSINDSVRQHINFTNMEGATDDNGYYTAHITVPTTAQTRAGVAQYLNFVICHEADPDPQSMNFTVNVDKVFEPGYRYIAPVNGGATANWLQISDATSLKAYLEAPTRNAILMADIDMNGVTVNHKSNETVDIIVLNDTFNGNGYTIKNITISSDGKDDLGLFRKVNKPAKVINLTVENMTIEGKKHTGAIAGDNAGVIENCKVCSSKITGKDGVGAIAGQNKGEVRTCEVYDTDVVGDSNVGGAVGYNDSGKIYSTSTCVTVKSTANNLGAVAGVTLNNGVIDACIVLENSVVNNIDGNPDTKPDGIAGITGKADKSTVTNCVSHATVTSEGKNTGGIVGYAVKSTIESCQNYGSVSATATNVGGVVGNADADCRVLACVNDGAITVATSTFTGGIVGSSSAIISGCVNRGTITANKQVGGILGFGNAKISACYNAGEIGKAIRVGGIIGEITVGGIVKGCYNFGAVGDHKLSGGIAGAKKEPYTIEECYSTVVKDTENGVDGIKIDSEADMNEHVATMNTAIQSLGVDSYFYTYSSIDDKGVATFVKK